MARAKGAEFLVNDRTDLAQSGSAVTALDDGGFAIGWVDQRSLPGADGEEDYRLVISDDVRGRAFGADGDARGASNLLSEGEERGSDQYIRMLDGITLDNGDVAFAWRTQYTDVFEEHARTFSAALAPRSGINVPEFIGSQSPRVGLDLVATGGDSYLLGYVSDDSIRLFSLAGESRIDAGVPAREADNFSLVDLAGNDAGFVYYGPIVADEGFDDTLNYRVLGADGAATGDPVGLPGTAGVSDTARLADGGIVVVTGDGVLSSALVIDMSGSVMVQPFVVGGAGAKVAALAGGGFAVAWEGGDGSGTGILARVYSAGGVADGPAIAVNTIVAGNQSRPDIAGLADGGFVVSWTDASGQGGDASGTSIKARVFTLDPAEAPLGAIASGAGNETFRGTAGKDIFFFDTAEDQPFGRDVIKGFGAGDRIVTTSLIFDANNDGVVRLDHSDRLALPGAGEGASTGSVKIFYENQKALSTVVLLGTEAHDGVNYYVYGGAGDASAQPGLSFGGVPA